MLGSLLLVLRSEFGLGLGGTMLNKPFITPFLIVTAPTSTADGCPDFAEGCPDFADGCPDFAEGGPDGGPDTRLNPLLATSATLFQLNDSGGGAFVISRNVWLGCLIGAIISGRAF